MSNYPGTIFLDYRTLPVFLLNVGDTVLAGAEHKAMTVLSVVGEGDSIVLTLKPADGALAYRVELDQYTPADVLYV